MTDVWTIGKALEWSKGYLTDSESPRVDAEVLLANAIDLTRVELYMHFHRPLNAEERQRFREYLKRRKSQEPVAQILGQREFFGRTFGVDRHVLVPRPETEMLIDEIIKCNETRPVRRILDVGTGSGCIAVTAMKELSERQAPDTPFVEAWDICPHALAMARSNAERHEVPVAFIECDMMDANTWQKSESKDEFFDVVVSNPPYIATDEISNLMVDVREFEPRMALDGGDDGLDCYRVLAEQASRRLNTGGTLLMELGWQQGDAVKSLLESGGWQEIAILNDLAGHPRVARAVKGD